MSEYGDYIIVKAGHPERDEWTNLGVIVFDDDGDRPQVWARMGSPERAIRRGDFPKETLIPIRVAQTPERVPNYAALKKTWDSMGHAMSCLQFHPGGRTLIREDVMLRLFHSLCPD